MHCEIWLKLQVANTRFSQLSPYAVLRILHGPLRAWPPRRWHLPRQVGWHWVVLLQCLLGTLGPLVGPVDFHGGEALPRGSWGQAVRQGQTSPASVGQVNHARSCTIL
jgi:hypothetical protein